MGHIQYNDFFKIGHHINDLQEFNSGKQNPEILTILVKRNMQQENDGNDRFHLCKKKTKEPENFFCQSFILAFSKEYN